MKKLYMIPLTEATILLSSELMHVQNPSTGEEFPGGPAGAPKRRTPVF